VRFTKGVLTYGVSKLPCLKCAFHAGALANLRHASPAFILPLSEHNTLLSYRHAFHDGNYADLLKHSVLDARLMHLCKKEAPFEYIDTHAGAVVYDLSAEHAHKPQ